MPGVAVASEVDGIGARLITEVLRLSVGSVSCFLKLVLAAIPRESSDAIVFVPSPDQPFWIGVQKWIVINQHAAR